MVAMDALYFGMLPQLRMTQFKETEMLRELNKAFLGFTPKSAKFHAYVNTTRNSAAPKPVATGNWGCGAFGVLALLSF